MYTGFMVCVSVVNYKDAVDDKGLRQLPPKVAGIDVPVFVDEGTMKEAEADGFYKGTLVVDTAGAGEFETLLLLQPGATA
ncbi:MAG: hypothetical protein ACTSU5_08680 [Promethearchaeota archaeon]